MDFGNRRKVDAAFNMSSMTDLVFLLLIFFIILSTMISPPSVKVNLPSGNTGKPPITANVNVSIDKDLTHYINKNLADVNTLEQDLLAIITQETRGEEKPVIVLRVDRDVPTGVTTNILVIARKNEWNIALATDGK